MLTADFNMITITCRRAAAGRGGRCRLWFRHWREAKLWFTAKAQADAELVGKLDNPEPISPINAVIVFVVAIKIEKIGIWVIVKTQDVNLGDTVGVGLCKLELQRATTGHKIDSACFWQDEMTAQGGVNNRGLIGMKADIADFWQILTWTTDKETWLAHKTPMWWSPPPDKPGGGSWLILVELKAGDIWKQGGQTAKLDVIVRAHKLEARAAEFAELDSAQAVVAGHKDMICGVVAPIVKHGQAVKAAMGIFATGPLDKRLPPQGIEDFFDDGIFNREGKGIEADAGNTALDW